MGLVRRRRLGGDSLASPLSLSGSLERGVGFARRHARWGASWQSRGATVAVWAAVVMFIAGMWFLALCYYLVLCLLPLLWLVALPVRLLGRSSRRERYAQRRHAELLAAMRER